MDLHYSHEDQKFRRSVRTWIDSKLPHDLRQKVLLYDQLEREDYLRWHRILAKQGWIAPHWHEQWGGTNWTVTQRYIFEEECAAAGCPMILPTGITMCGPVIQEFGTADQKKRFLPDIYDGRAIWCQGYSEPGAGSDLASLITTATRQGDEFVVSGQKIWTTWAHFADWMFCLVRTDPNATKKQHGISFLLVDMKMPGVVVRPFELMSETHEVNEVYLDEVKVPVENLVHEENDGWTVAKYLLGYERLLTAEVGRSKRDLARVKQLAARDGGNISKPNSRFGDRVARVEIDLMALELTNLRFLDRLERGGRLGAEVSLLKLRGTEIQQALSVLLMEIAGPMCAPARPLQSFGFDQGTANLTLHYCNHRKASIYGGSNEIQRNIIAKQALGL